MIDGSKKSNRQLAFELQNSHVCEKRSKRSTLVLITSSLNNLLRTGELGHTSMSSIHSH